ncbi:MAG: methyltransferase domain-containing protein [Deltaproteobacteria bacterium]|jgi:predicted TPR repeat methyltransferase|nr:methyltransferase domain-containing protein [Deltaproteobacteria bacterium]MBW2500218.1 methyltransferase domain-containing protein [Deltaproteobacteria bacterium]
MTKQLPFDDYRSSHLGKGDEYHDKFSRFVYTSIIWDIEQRTMLQVVDSLFRGAKKVRHLDFACGTGRILHLLAPKVENSTGVDISDSMLAVAKEQTPSARLICADLTRSDDLADEQFDLITSFRLFPNAEPRLREEAMAQLAKRLAPGGFLIFNNHKRCGSLYFRWRSFLTRIGLKKKKKSLHCMSDAEAIDLAGRYGLELVSEHPIGVMPILRRKRPLVPRWLIRAVENWAAGRAGLARHAAFKIYVFRHAQAPA